jgi:hypothetical protein
VHPSRFPRPVRHKRIVVALSLAALAVSLIAPAVQARDTIPDRLFRGRNAPYKLPEPSAPLPGPNSLVPPPGEDPYFPIRADGQPYVNNIDTRVNMTDWVNHYYFDPHWRGENWTPFDSFEIVERLVRRMALWEDYDQQTEGRVGNHIAKFFEKWTGYGP